jgi:hypothetical protein
MSGDRGTRTAGSRRFGCSHNHMVRILSGTETDKQHMKEKRPRQPAAGLMFSALTGVLHGGCRAAGSGSRDRDRDRDRDRLGCDA